MSTEVQNAWHWVSPCIQQAAYTNNIIFSYLSPPAVLFHGICIPTGVNGEWERKCTYTVSRGQNATSTSVGDGHQLWATELDQLAGNLWQRLSKIDKHTKKLHHIYNRERWRSACSSYLPVSWLPRLSPVITWSSSSAASWAGFKMSAFLTQSSTSSMVPRLASPTATEGGTSRSNTERTLAFLKVKYFDSETGFAARNRESLCKDSFITRLSLLISTWFRCINVGEVYKPNPTDRETPLNQDNVQGLS